MSGLSPRHDRALKSILDGRRAWTSAKRLERRYGSTTVAELVAAGWIERWSRDRLGRRLTRESITLTSLGAFRLGFEIDERLDHATDEEIPFWVQSGTPKHPIYSTSKTVHMSFPERVPDPRSLPRYVADLETGEITTDPEEAATLLGVPVTYDRRDSRKASATDRRRTAAARAKKRVGPMADPSAR